MIRFFGEFWAVALPIVLIAAGVAAFLFVVCFAIYRRRRLAGIARGLYHAVCHRHPYDYQRIFRSYIERFNAIKDRRELFATILEFMARVIGADGASLLVRDAAKDTFVVRASYGTKPFGFDVSEVKHFIEWLGQRREMVTRHYLLNSKKCRDIKIEGLRYCVQFNAEACVPVFVGGKLYALLNLGARTRGAYDRETRTILSLLVMQFAIAIHNVMIHETVEKRSAELAHMTSFRNRLLMNLSHELRTPLNSIIGLAEMMAEGGDGPVTEDQMLHLSMIRQSGTRLLDTVTAMLDLSKIESNRLELNVKHLSLARLVGEAASRVTLPKDTKLVIDLKDGVPGVYGDEDRLRQVVHHLLDNAAKFTGHGKITVDASKAGEMLVVSVKDTGVGIRKDAQKHLFDGFYQADSGHAREREGLGVGLSIARKIVEIHGGRMWFKSTLGKGSEFYFTLPLKPTGLKHHEIPSTT